MSDHMISKMDDLIGSGLSMQEEMQNKLDQALEAVRVLREVLGLLKLEVKISADGTHLKCTCPREGCHSIWCSAGDKIFRLSYVDADKFDAALEKTAGYAEESK